MFNAVNSNRKVKDVEMMVNYKLEIVDYLNIYKVGPKTEQVLLKMISILDKLEDCYQKGLIFPWIETDMNFNRFLSKRFPRSEEFIKEIFSKAYKFKKDLLPSGNLISNEELYKSDRMYLKKLSSSKKLVELTQKDFDKIEKILNKLSLRSKALKFNKNYTIKEILEDIPTSTSSGYPIYQKKGSEVSISHCANEIENIFSKQGSEILRRLMENPVSIFHRFTPKLKNFINDDKSINKNFDLDVKKRIIQCVNFPILSLEYLMFKEFSENFKEMEEFSYFNRKTDTSDETLKVRSMLKYYSKIICGDFENFDANISPRIILLIISSILINIDFEDDVKLKEISEYYAIFYMYTPLIGSTGINFTNGSHITGCYITSVFASMCTYFIVNLTCSEEELIEGNRIRILGDDFILATDEDKNLLIGKMKDNFGFIMNEEKVYVSYDNDSISYLGFKWNSNGEPETDYNWILGRTIYPERFLDIDGRIRTYQRICSIVFQCKDGLEIMKETILKYDNYFKKCYNEGFDPIINYVDKIGISYNFKVPLSNLIEYGWRAI